MIILLATYNGERYISEQIVSLLSQSYQDFKIFISDDRSTDNTFSIINDYANKHPGKIIAKQNDTNTGSAKLNFLRMMVEYKDDYVMLCDQDDIWLPDKVEKSLNKIKAMEEEFGKGTPVLVHTDLTVVDENLNIIASSYAKMSNKDFSLTTLNFAVTMNNVAGCTAIYNRALAELIQEVPGFFVMHDWWLSLTAAVFGKIGSLNEPAVLYRQHGENEKGAKKVLSPKYMFYVLSNLKTMRAMIEDSYKQAGMFVEIYRDIVNEEKLGLLSAYASIPGLPVFKRLGTVIKYKTFMNGFARKAIQIFILKTSFKKRDWIYKI